MRWLKHMTDTRDDERVANLIAQAGHEGYGLWWAALEVIAKNMDKDSQKCSVRYPISTWAAKLQLSPQNVCRQLAVVVAAGLLELRRDGAMLELSSPKLLKYRDEYSKKSGHSPDNVRSKKQNTDTEAETDKQHAESAPDESPIRNPRPNPKAEADEAIARWLSGEFWPIYWRKSDKAGALASAKKHCRTEEVRAAALAGVRQQTAEMMSRQPEHRPHAATWINHHRWEDEPQLPGLVIAARAGVAPTRSDLALQRLVEDLQEEACRKS